MLCCHRQPESEHQDMLCRYRSRTAAAPVLPFSCRYHLPPTCSPQGILWLKSSAGVVARSRSILCSSRVRRGVRSGRPVAVPSRRGRRRSRAVRVRIDQEMAASTTGRGSVSRMIRTFPAADTAPAPIPGRKPSRARPPADDGEPGGDIRSRNAARSRATEQTLPGLELVEGSPRSRLSNGLAKARPLATWSSIHQSA